MINDEGRTRSGIGHGSFSLRRPLSAEGRAETTVGGAFLSPARAGCDEIPEALALGASALPFVERDGTIHWDDGLVHGGSDFVSRFTSATSCASSFSTRYSGNAATRIVSSQLISTRPLTQAAASFRAHASASAFGEG